MNIPAPGAPTVEGSPTGPLAESRTRDRILQAISERGPITAAQAIISFSHPGRCRSDAAFAALAGTSPSEASSGPIVRHRLNRGGNRRLNAILYRIAVTQAGASAQAKAYLVRRAAEGKSRREAHRALKRHLVRTV